MNENMIFKDNTNLLSIFKGSDDDIAKDWEEEHKQAEMIDRPLIYVHQSGGTNNGSIGITQGGTFNYGSPERITSKRDQEKVPISIFFC